MPSRNKALRAAVAGVCLALAGCSVATTSTESSPPSPAATSSPASPSPLATATTPASASASASTSVTPTPESAEPTCATVDAVTVQLPGPIGARVAGFVAARDRGMFERDCLDVTLVDGEPTIDPAVSLGQGSSDFAVTWVPAALNARERGAAITEIAQIFQRSGTVQVARASAGITSAANFKGRLIGIEEGNHEFEVLAAITKAGLDPVKDVTVIPQPSDPVALLTGAVDAIQTTTYEGVSRLLMAKNPSTGKPMELQDLTIVDYNSEGVAVLQDSIWASAPRLSDPAYQDVTQRFITATLEGWIHCRDEPADCASLLASAGASESIPVLAWKLNEVNKLIWPSPAGIGVINPAAWDRTATIALYTRNLQGESAITAMPDQAGYTNTYAEAANAALTAAGLDTTGTGFAPLTLTLPTQ